jgi:hypothetical protein
LTPNSRKSSKTPRADEPVKTSPATGALCAGGGKVFGAG